MKLKQNGEIEFASCKELIEYIRQFDNIECNRDLSTLLQIAEDYDCVTSPIVNEDGGGSLEVEKGYFDEFTLEGVIEGAHDLIDMDSDGILLEANVGGIRFIKDGRFGEWQSFPRDVLDKLPWGYDEDELEEELSSSLANPTDVYDLISEVLDKATDVDEQFQVSYRDFRTEEDDIDEIASQLQDFEFEMLYECDGEVRGWRKDLLEETEDFVDEAYVKSHAIDVMTAAAKLLSDL